MNSIFQIGAKLVGIIFLTRGIIGISYFGQIFSLTEEGGNNYVIGIIATLLSVTVNIAFSLLLIFKTNSVEKIERGQISPWLHLECKASTCCLIEEQVRINQDIQ